MLETKQCLECCLSLPFSDFGRRGEDFSNRCKKCVNQKEYKRRKENLEKHNQTQRDARKARNNKKICKVCKNPIIENRTLCEKHWFIDISKNRVKAATIQAGEALRQKWVNQNYKCPYTGELLKPGVNMHLDHIYPVSRFPDQAHDINNVEWILESVNKAKGKMTKEEFLYLCERIVKYSSKNKP